MKTNNGATYLDLNMIQRYLDYAWNYIYQASMVNVVGWSPYEAKHSFLALSEGSGSTYSGAYSLISFYKVPDATTASTHDISYDIEDSDGNAVTPALTGTYSIIVPYRFPKVGSYDPALFDFNEKYWSGYVEIRHKIFHIDSVDLNADRLIKVNFTPCALRSNLSVIDHTNCNILNTLIVQSGPATIIGDTRTPLNNSYRYLHEKELVNHLVQFMVRGGVFNKIKNLYMTSDGDEYTSFRCKNNNKNVLTPFYGAYEGLIEKHIIAKNTLDGKSLQSINAMKKQNNTTTLRSERLINYSTFTDINARFYSEARTSAGLISSEYSHLEATRVGSSSGSPISYEYVSDNIACMALDSRALLENILFKPDVYTSDVGMNLNPVAGDPINTRLLAVYDSLFNSSSLKYYDCDLLIPKSAGQLQDITDSTAGYEEVAYNPFFFQPFNRPDVLTKDSFVDLSLTSSLYKNTISFKGVNYNEL